MQLRSGERKIDAYQPTFDPNLDIATVVFSHVQLSLIHISEPTRPY